MRLLLPSYARATLSGGAGSLPVAGLQGRQVPPAGDRGRESGSVRGRSVGAQAVLAQPARSSEHGQQTLTGAGKGRNFVVSDRRASERLQRRLLFFDDLEELVQLGDLKDFVDLRIDVAQDEPATGLLKLLVQRDEFTEGSAGEVFDVAEVEENLSPTFFVYQTEQLLTDDLDILLIEDLAIDEVDHGDIADMLDLEPAATSG